MATALHHRITEQPRLGRFLAWSLGLHAAMLVILTFTVSNSVRIAPPAALQVKLVGVPQPTPAAKKEVIPEEIRTQDSPAPKEPPPDMKNLPTTELQSKFALDENKEKAQTDKQQLVKANERPPVLDKNPKEKKVVKNKPDAKVVKDPEDFLKALEFVDKLDKSTPSPTTTAKKTDKPAGEGPKIQLNLADQGTVDGIRSHIEKNWLIPPGMDTRGLNVGVEVRVDTAGNVTYVNVSSGSGNGAFDQSLVRAVRKASPLPIPSGKFETFQVMDLEFIGQ